MDKYDKLPLNPFKCEPKEYMWKKYPQLARRTAFSSIPKGMKGHITLAELNKLIKFVVLYIDPLSPLFEEKDFEHRTNVAMEDLGFTKKEKFFKHIENQTLFFKNLVYEYFQMVNNHEYEAWYTMKINLHHINRKLRDPSTDLSNRRQLTKAITEFKTELIELENKILPDQYTMNIVSDLATADKLASYAEKYAWDLPEI